MNVYEKAKLKVAAGMVLTEAEQQLLESSSLIAVEYKSNIVLYVLTEKLKYRNNIQLYHDLERYGLDLIVLNIQDINSTVDSDIQYPIIYYIPSSINIEQAERMLSSSNKSFSVKNVGFAWMVRELHEYNDKEEQSGVQPIPELTGGGRSLSLTVTQLKQLHSKHQFVPCRWQSEYDHECEIGVLIDIPPGLTKDQIGKLIDIVIPKAHGGIVPHTHYTKDMVSHFFSECGDFEKMMVSYDPGIQFKNGKCIIYQYKCMEWIKQLDVDENDNDFDG